MIGSKYRVQFDGRKAEAGRDLWACNRDRRVPNEQGTRRYLVALAARTPRLRLRVDAFQIRLKRDCKAFRRLERGKRRCGVWNHRRHVAAVTRPAIRAESEGETPSWPRRR
jgi:hypothetical protein